MSRSIVTKVEKLLESCSNFTSAFSTSSSSEHLVRTSIQDFTLNLVESVLWAEGVALRDRMILSIDSRVALYCGVSFPE